MRKRGFNLPLHRFPLLASEFKPYPYGIFSDSLAQKGVLYTTIQIKDEILHIFSTHTQASYFGENQVHLNFDGREITNHVFHIEIPNPYKS